MNSMERILIGLVLMFSGELCFASSHHPEDHFSHLPVGGRKALHGMVVFGAGPYFLEHIPTLTPPHDFQIIAKVTLKNENGPALNFDFSRQGYTLKPSATFALNDYVAGRLKKFTASIHQGSFEKGGPVISGLENVIVEIHAYKVIRQLPEQSSEISFQLSDGKNTFESNVIRPNQNFQSIRNVNTGEILWCVKAPDFFESCQ